jgi:hypothetical protein
MSIDGHFWVERNGKIIDPHFAEYDMIAKIRECDSQTKNYVEAPLFTQVLMYFYADKHYKNNGTGFRNCYSNAVKELKRKPGGRLVFGSMGFKFNKQDDYFYEFGGKDWKLFIEFIR